MKCSDCSLKNATVKLPSTLKALCKECFYAAVELNDLHETSHRNLILVHNTIITNKLFSPGQKVAIAVSGGKDSTVLAEIITTLNQRYNYGLELCLLSIDEGIKGYRDDSLETVKKNQVEYKIPLKILSYEELYGWTMDRIVAEIGLKNNCTFCGVFRRQALDRGAVLLGVEQIITGHNADDIAETVLMNIMRGDFSRLLRCTAIKTSSNDTQSIPRSKPFKYTYEKEIVMYAYFKNLEYFSTECIYSPNAYRGHARTFLKDLEAIRPSTILDIIHSAESYQATSKSLLPHTSTRLLGNCSRCGYMASNLLCKACVMLEGLNKGLPRLAVGNTKMQKELMNSGTGSERVMQTFADLKISREIKGTSQPKVRDQ